MAGRKYSREQKEKFFDLLDRGGTVRAAATAAGVHPEAAYTWLRQAGMSMRRASPRVYSEEEKAAFFRLLAQRNNVSAVARELGFTQVTCYKWAHQAGIFTSEARQVNPRRERFLRLRQDGMSRAEAAAEVGQTSAPRPTGTEESGFFTEAVSIPTGVLCGIAKIGYWPA